MCCEGHLVIASSHQCYAGVHTDDFVGRTGLVVENRDNKGIIEIH